MTTSMTDIIKNERLHDGLAMLASFYARRLLEDQYDRLMKTPTAEKVKQLNRPTKLGIEAAVNVLAAYVSTKEESLTAKPWQKFLFEVLMDAPPELNKRLLNGTRHNDTDESAAIPENEKEILNTFRQLDPNTASILLEWLRTAKQEDRIKLSEYLSTLVSHTEHQGKGRVEHDTDHTDANSNAKATKTTEAPGMLSDLTSLISKLNERMEQNKKNDLGGHNHEYS